MDYSVNGITFRSSDGSLYINGFGWLPGNIIQKLLDFFIMVRDVCQILSFVHLFIFMMIGWSVGFLDEIGYELSDEFYNFIGPIALAIEIVAATFMIPFTISFYICEILEWFLEKFINAKNKQIRYFRITRFMERIDRFPFLKLLFQKISPTF